MPCEEGGKRAFLVRRMRGLLQLEAGVGGALAECMVGYEEPCLPGLLPEVVQCFSEMAPPSTSYVGMWCYFISDISCWRLKMIPFQLTPCCSLSAGELNLINSVRVGSEELLCRPSPTSHLSAQKRDSAAARDRPGSGWGCGRKARAKTQAFSGEMRKRHSPKPNLLCEKSIPIHLEHCTFLSLKVMTCCCNATVSRAGMCDINRLLNNQFCKRGKVKLHLIL